MDEGPWAAEQPRGGLDDTAHKDLTTLPAVDWPPRSLQFFQTSLEVVILTQGMWVATLPVAGVLFEII